MNVTRCDNCGRDIESGTTYWEIEQRGVVYRPTQPGYGTVFIGGMTRHVCTPECGAAWFSSQIPEEKTREAWPTPRCTP